MKTALSLFVSTRLTLLTMGPFEISYEIHLYQRKTYLSMINSAAYAYQYISKRNGQNFITSKYRMPNETIEI